ncbi:MAG: sensor histidine kinase [Nitriliruptoraceae bacterium]
MSWWREQPELLRDAVGAVPIALLVAVNQSTPEEASVTQVIVTMLVVAVAMTVRRRRPLVTYLAALLVVAIAQTGLEFLAVASYTVVVHTSRPRALLVVATSAVAALAGYLRYWSTLSSEAIVGDLVLIAAIAVLPVVLGCAVRNARKARAELEARNAELVELRGREAAHAVQRERLRIARELHDVVAHHVSAMTLRANAGRHLATRDPEAAADALDYIATSGRATLDEMRTFVGALRGDEVSASGALAPTPGLADLPELLASYRRGGLTVDAELDDVGGDVPTAVGLHVYRIVEEGLTNVLRHSGAERAWVRLRCEDGTIHLTVDDNGHGLPDDGPHDGHGLVGIAERVALQGGRCNLGPGPHGGCRLEASLLVTPASTEVAGRSGTPAAVGP